MASVDERTSDILPQERAAFGEDRGSNNAGGDGSSTGSDSEGGEMGVAGVMGYVRSNMEDLLWVSRVLVGRTGEPSTQPGQGTRWDV